MEALCLESDRDPIWNTQVGFFVHKQKGCNLFESIAALDGRKQI